jgi:uncharacterized cofD-like protein
MQHTSPEKGMVSPQGKKVSHASMPRVVALGGGTGLPIVLRSLKNRLFSASSMSGRNGDRDRLTAIVTITDDGGSSGRLRRDFNILPPGDIRNCLFSLSDESIQISNLFQYRFDRGNGLSGHSLGNLLLTALTHVKGNFLEAIRCCSEIMRVKGQILPFTSEDVVLGARFRDGLVVKGETFITGHRGRIQNIFLIPADPAPLPQTIEAIEKADAIIIGPGSLYTSIIPNLLANGITREIRKSKAKKIYICNTMTEPGETDGYTASDHIRAIYDHTEYGLFQYILLNKGKISSRFQNAYETEGACAVTHDIEELRHLGLTSVVADLITERDSQIRHDEEKLGRLLLELIPKN